MARKQAQATDYAPGHYRLDVRLDARDRQFNVGDAFVSWATDEGREGFSFNSPPEARLVIHCQQSDMHEGDRPGTSYAWRVAVAEDCTLQTMETYHPILARLQKALDAWESKFGYVPDWATYLAIVADAIGIREGRILGRQEYPVNMACLIAAVRQDMVTWHQERGVRAA